MSVGFSRSGKGALAALLGQGVARRITLGLLLFVLVAAGLLVTKGKTWPHALGKAMERADARFERAGRTFANETERTRVVLKAVGTGHLARTCVWWATLVNAVLRAACWRAAGGGCRHRKRWHA